MPPSYRDVHFKLLAGFIEFKFYNYLILWRGGEDGKMKKFHKWFFFREQYQIGSVPNVGGGGGGSWRNTAEPIALRLFPYIFYAA